MTGATRRNAGGLFKTASAMIWAAFALFALAACASESGGMAATASATEPARVENRQESDALASATPIPAPTATVAVVPTATPVPESSATPIPATATPSPAPSATVAVVPTETPIPASTATAIPTATPIPAPSAPPSAIPDAGYDAFAFLEKFTLEYSPRESATEDELEAARFLQSELEAMGYDTELRGFDVRRIDFGVSIGGSADTLEAYRIELSGEGIAEGALVDVGAGFADDIPAGGLDGKIALIERGIITFEEKIHRVADAGAVAAIIYNTSPWPFLGRLSTRADIPAASIGGDAGLNLRNAARDGEIMAAVSAVPTVSQSRNLVARMADDSADMPTVIIGAHYDTVEDTQGANDNGSGVAALMEIAKRASARDYPFAVKFVLFGAEEIGLYGSIRYAEEMGADEIANTLAMLNLDVVGSGGGFEAIGDFDLARTAREVGEEIGERVLVTPSENADFTSDHAPFAAVGIPALFLLADDMSRINSPQDELQYVNPRLPGASAEIVMRLLDRLAERAGAESARVRSPDPRESWNGGGIWDFVDWWEWE